MKKKKIILLLIITVINISLVKALDKDNEFGKIKIDKYASKEDVTYGRSANVTLEVNGSSFEKKNTLDVVLILDRSSSMNDNLDNQNKMGLVKTEAKSLVNDILKQDGNVRIGIVTFGTKVLDKYSSKGLASDKTKLDALIDSIPNYLYNEATNVQDALSKAEALLRNSIANKKAIILLTDGAPTKFTYKGKTYGTGNNDNQVCYIGKGKNCTKSSPSTMAKVVANELKKSATIFTIGFGVIDDAFLSEIASSKNDFYLANGESKLRDNFDDIVRKVNVIANNIVVTDVIPATFVLDKDSVKVPNNTTFKIVNNDDKTTKIIWKIGDLDATLNYKLTYNITAVAPYYGSMNTNSRAYLEGNALKNNDYYKNKNILLTFPKPNVPIPALTNDDDYSNVTLYRQNKLMVNANDGILTNDNLYQVNDSNANIKNSVVIVPNSLSCGKLDDINVLEDGGFTYSSSNECLGDITFDYYIMSNVDDTVVISNTSTVTLHVSKKPTSYTVKYLDYESKKPLHDEKVLDVYLYDEIREEAVHIDNYNLIGDNVITKAIDKENEEIIFYYVRENNIAYVVDYYFDDVLDLNKREIFINNKLGALIDNYPDKLDYGYVLDRVDNLPLTLKENLDDNVIGIYYKRLTGNVIVNFIDINGKKLSDSVTITDYVNNLYDTNPMEIDGYKFVKVMGSPQGKIMEGNVEITYIYELIIPKTGVSYNYWKEIISLSSFVLLMSIIVVKKHLKRN